MSRAGELARQQAVLALLAAEETPALLPGGNARLRPDHTASIGLRAYQRNAQATARRVLLAHFPTVAAMLGEDTLAALALILWQTSPPTSGDLGEWGAALPDLLASHPDLQDWPWLADTARLDWARHLCERAADASLDAGSLQRLGDTPPEQLRLVLMPGLQCLVSPWPVRALWEAHQLTPDAQEQAAVAALQGLSGEPRTLLAWRGPDWQIHMLELSAAQGAWMRMLLDASLRDEPLPLSQMLDDAPAGLDFSAWLGQAITEGWLWRVDAAASPQG